MWSIVSGDDKANFSASRERGSSSPLCNNDAGGILGPSSFNYASGISEVVIFKDARVIKIGGGSFTSIPVGFVLDFWGFWKLQLPF